MNKIAPRFAKNLMRSMYFAALSLIVVLGTSMPASADEADAKRILKSMSDYLAAQDALSFDYDATLEVVTFDGQKLALASSGSLSMERPDKLSATRAGGFADTATSFDGKTLTILGKNENLYTQIDIPGTIDNLVDELRFEYNRPLPAADLLLTNAYEELMHGVTDIKDLGSAVIGGVECDYLAFRTEEVDWQIWIAQGDRPYPCRYVITSKLIEDGPQYSIQTSKWKSGRKAKGRHFTFKNKTDATKVDLKDLKGTGDLPDHFKMGESK
ncbi:MAG: DUF2092 domain-containing protein [Woeseiaceae bacterium]